MIHSRLLLILSALALLACAAEPPAPEPEPQPPSVDLPLTARGNEPFWSLDIADDQIVYKTPENMDGASFPTPAPEPIPGGTRFAAVADDQRLEVAILDQPCTDSMSGMPYPKTVQVSIDSRNLSGCGGEPADLLTGGEWTVTQLDGEPVESDAPATLRFDVEGKVSGKAFCNNFSGGYELTGEGLTVGRMASTRMACPPPLMELEQRMTTILADVRRFEIGEDGALTLHASDGRSLRATR